MIKGEIPEWSCSSSTRGSCINRASAGEASVYHMNFYHRLAHFLQQPEATSILVCTPAKHQTAFRGSLQQPVDRMGSNSSITTTASSIRYLYARLPCTCRFVIKVSMGFSGKTLTANSIVEHVEMDGEPSLDNSTTRSTTTLMILLPFRRPIPFLLMHSLDSSNSDRPSRWTRPILPACK